jgi:hypothetical protein
MQPSVACAPCRVSISVGLRLALACQPLFPSSHINRHSWFFSMASSKKPVKCELLELVQYHCTIKEDDLISCQPIERVFRKCAGRPLVEVTHIVKVDEETGQFYLPAQFKEAMPPSHHWEELRR